MSTTLQSTIKIEKEVSELFGKPLKRKEDLRFLSGNCKFVDDIKAPSMLYASVVRSSYAHAKINSIKTDLAQFLSGVRAIYTGRDLSTRVPLMPAPSAAEERRPIARPVLASSVVNYVGEPVCFVVANDRYIAEDAAEMVEIEYSPLEPVVDPEVSIRPEAERIHARLNNNIGYHYVKEGGNIDQAFGEAEKIVKLKTLNQRVAPAPMEPRAVLSSYDAGSDSITVWTSTQSPFEVRSGLADILKMQENKVHIIVPDVGGAFGAKSYLYSEDVLACIASIDLGHPVKWIENRSENLATMFHGRGQIQSIEASVKGDGTVIGIKASIISDSGAYSSPETFGDPEITINMIPGPYALKNFRGELFCVYTNKVSFDAYRGAGRPEATFIIERAIDEIARELGLDPSEVRLKNFIQSQQFPYKSPTGYEYDKGEYEANLRKALEFANYNKWRVVQREERRKTNGRIIGIGMCTFLEISSWAPDFPQSASITVMPSGAIRVISGTLPQGQGHETPFAQIVADELGVDIEKITVTFGDTDKLPWGSSTGGSRSAALGGSAVKMCAQKIRQKMAEIAGKELGGLDPNSLVFRDEKIFQEREPDKSVTFDSVAAISYVPSKLPKDMEATLFAYSVFSPQNWTFPYGTHVCVVEIDRETGTPKILDYAGVDDVGRMINPMIVEGQVHGGVGQGVGQALLEEVVYGNGGELLTSNFMDYQIPNAADTVNVRWTNTFVPTKFNLLGVKGVGENGTVAATPAVVNAVVDALSPYGVRDVEMPIKPEKVWALIK